MLQQGGIPVDSDASAFISSHDAMHPAGLERISPSTITLPTMELSSRWLLWLPLLFESCFRIEMSL